MHVKACRGVCIGIERHLVKGEVADLETALVTYLLSIGAVEAVPDESITSAIAETEEGV